MLQSQKYKRVFCQPVYIPPKLLGGISSYFTVKILVWSYKFFKDFYSNHDAGCHDNQREKTFDISLKNGYWLILHNWSQCVSCIIPHGEGSYYAVIKTEHSSKLYWADFKVIRHIFYLKILRTNISYIFSNTYSAEC